MKRLVLIGLSAALVALAGAGAEAQQMRVPYGPGLTLDQARKCMATAEREARANNWNVAIAVVDTGGHLVAFEKMDNVQVGSIHVAIDKAASANNFRRPTKALADVVARGGHAILGMRGATPLEGGVPLVLDGKIAGGVGVSGELPAQDDQIARACTENFGK